MFLELDFTSMCFPKIIFSLIFWKKTLFCVESNSKNILRSNKNWYLNILGSETGILSDAIPKNAILRP
jgi:hypothetical protein